MKIEIPDNLLNSGNISEQELLVEIAIVLYTKANYSWANAARFAQLTRDEFKHELWKRKIALKYDTEDFDEDMNNAKFLLNDSGE